MRKSLWIVPVLVLIAVIGAPNARADTLFTYTYTVTAPTQYTLSWSTKPIPAVTAETIVSAADLTNASLTGSLLGGCAISQVALDWGNSGDQITGFTNATNAVCLTAVGVVESADQLPLLDYSTVGTYTFTVSNPNLFIQADTLVVTAVQTPEPSTFILMLTGFGSLGLMVVMRKCIAKGLRQAT